MFCAAQNAVSASGSEPPSRKENAERACSSTYFAGSVIHPFHKPLAARELLKHAINSCRRDQIQLEVQFDVPLIALPLTGFVPPRAGSAPGSTSAQHLL